MTFSFSPDELGAFSAAVKASESLPFPGQYANRHFFPEFKQRLISANGVAINTLIGGSGPPLLLLHGYPETHVSWHKIAGTLARKFTVVMTDLRGYGDSSKPDGGPDHIHYSKREMGRDQVEVMSALGFRRFQAVGHDRGGRALFQMMLDYPENVERAVLLDIAPTDLTYAHTDAAFATKYFWWFFHIQPAPLPERLINATPEFYLTSHLSLQNKTPFAITPEAYAEYFRCFQNPACVHATCEDYRAAAGIDASIEKESGGRKAQQPLMILWGQKGSASQSFDVLSLWREKASNVSGRPLPSGHFIAEEAPDELLEALDGFLQS